MNDAERELIAGLFQRIRSVETARRDPEAEAFISEQVARQPHAPYAMAQTVVVQDRALEAARSRIAELEQQLADAREDAERLQQTAPSSTPSSAPSPWGPRAQETMARAEAARQGGNDQGNGFTQSGGYQTGSGMSPPFGAPRTGYGDQRQTYGDQPGYGREQGYGAPSYPGQPQPQQPQAGGGFLSGALQTAAGVAAGALIFQGVRSMFGGGEEAKAAAGESGAGEAAKLEGAGQSADAGGDASTSSIGDWYSGLFGGGAGAQQASNEADDDGGLFDPDDGDDWT